MLRTMSRALRHHLRSLAEDATPYLPHRATGDSRPPSARLYCVYRAANTSHVLRLLDAFGPSVVANLHALDATTEELASATRHVGKGHRTVLLQRLMDDDPPRPDEYLIVSDDDVTFARSGRTRLLDFVQAGQLDIAQPAHARESHLTFENLRIRPFTTARTVGFVEVGPLVVMSPRARRVLLPFPPEARMGWGLDVMWATQAVRHGLRLGVVDATPMRHHGVVGAAYSAEFERTYLRDKLMAAGVSSPHELSKTLPPEWRVGRAHPPWR